MANDDGPIGEMVRIFRLAQDAHPSSPDESMPEVAVLAWLKPHMATKGLFESVEKWYKTTTNSDIQHGPGNHAYPVSCGCPWCASCTCPTCKECVLKETEWAKIWSVLVDDEDSSISESG